MKSKIGLKFLFLLSSIKVTLCKCSFLCIVTLLTHFKWYIFVFDHMFKFHSAEEACHGDEVEEKERPENFNVGTLE